MKFWDDVTKTASDAANYTVKKAGEFTTSAKIKHKLHLAETRLACTYEGIGRLYYNAVMHGEKNTEAISSLMADVAEINIEIDECKAQLADVKSKRICPACGAAVPADSAFCGKCGAKVD